MEKFYFDNGNNRVGDEITMTALLKYYKVKHPDCQIAYFDNNRYIHSRFLFPAGLVDFVDSSLHWIGHTPLQVDNLWIWTPFLRLAKIYTELREKQSINPEHEVVFCPLIEPPYDVDRGMDVIWACQLFQTIRSNYPSSLMVIDVAKRNLFSGKIASNNIIFSDSFELTFGLIKNSKVYIGGDSGTSHYAGAIGHQDMIILHRTQEHLAIAFRETQLQMSEKYNEPIMAHESMGFNSHPCCNPNQYLIHYLQQNKLPISTVMDSINMRFQRTNLVS